MPCRTSSKIRGDGKQWADFGFATWRRGIGMSAARLVSDQRLTDITERNPLTKGATE